MDELGAGMAELAGQVTALAALGRTIAAGPVGRTAALAYGVRRAVGLRREARRTLPGRVMERGELTTRGGGAPEADLTARGEAREAERAGRREVS